MTELVIAIIALIAFIPLYGVSYRNVFSMHRE